MSFVKSITSDFDRKFPTNAPHSLPSPISPLPEELIDIIAQSTDDKGVCALSQTCKLYHKWATKERENRFHKSFKTMRATKDFSVTVFHAEHKITVLRTFLKNFLNDSELKRLEDVSSTEWFHIDLCKDRKKFTLSIPNRYYSVLGDIISRSPNAVLLAVDLSDPRNKERLDKEIQDVSRRRADPQIYVIGYNGKSDQIQAEISREMIVKVSNDYSYKHYEIESPEEAKEFVEKVLLENLVKEFVEKVPRDDLFSELNNL